MQQYPFTAAAAITPSNSAGIYSDNSSCDALYVGGAGNAAVVLENGSNVTLNGLLAGNVYHIRIRQVKSTGTTATNLIALQR